jgi:hypothetical protein
VHRAGIDPDHPEARLALSPVRPLRGARILRDRIRTSDSGTNVPSLYRHAFLARAKPPAFPGGKGATAARRALSIASAAGLPNRIPSSAAL